MAPKARRRPLNISSNGQIDFTSAEASSGGAIILFYSTTLRAPRPVRLFRSTSAMTLSVCRNSYRFSCPSRRADSVYNGVQIWRRSEGLGTLWASIRTERHRSGQPRAPKVVISSSIMDTCRRILERRWWKPGELGVATV